MPPLLKMFLKRKRDPLLCDPQLVGSTGTELGIDLLHSQKGVGPVFLEDPKSIRKFPYLEKQDS